MNHIIDCSHSPMHVPYSYTDLVVLYLLYCINSYLLAVGGPSHWLDYEWVCFTGNVRLSLSD